MEQEQKALDDAILRVAEAANGVSENAELGSRGYYVVPDDDMTDLRLALGAWHDASERFLAAQARAMPRCACGRTTVPPGARVVFKLSADEHSDQECITLAK